MNKGKRRLMTNQKIFDTVCRHLAKQKQKAIGDIGTYVYETEDGLKCAVGCLITADEMQELRRLNMISFCLTDITAKLKFKNFGKRNFRLLERLQHAHDFCKYKKNLILYLKSIAKKHNLKSNKTSLIKEWNG